MFKNIIIKVGQLLGLDYLFNFINNKHIIPSSLLLILVNMIPIIGFITYNWNPYDIVTLYWLENVVVGLYTIVRMIFTKKEVEKILDQATPSKETLSSIAFLKPLLIIVFIFTYGLFTIIHGSIIYSLILGKTSFYLENNFSGMYIFFISLLISHGYSLVSNYFIKKEFEYHSTQSYLTSPYKRLCVIQATLIIGWMLSLYLPKMLMLVFVFFKILYDLKEHQKSHLKENAFIKTKKQIDNINDSSLNLVP